MVYIQIEEMKMRKEDLFKKNHILGVEFDRYLLEHPEILEQIPENAEIYFIPEEDLELSQENLKIAEAQKAVGRKVVLVKIGKLSPPRSRLQDVRLESMAF
jgi:exopolysaccharide biosynthesis predicted pyruvyltransferase EpsI